MCAYSSVGGLMLTQDNFSKTGTLIVEAVPFMKEGLVQSFGLVSLEQDVGVVLKFDEMEAKSNNKLILEIRFGRGDKEIVEILSSPLVENGNGLNGDHQREFKLEVGLKSIGVFMEDELLIDTVQIDSDANSTQLQTAIE